MDIKQKLRTETSARDEVFRTALSYLNNRPAEFIEIGCLRDLNSRAGDGWSTLHWADYVERNGGGVHFCDINKESLDLCSELVSKFDIVFTASHKDGSEMLAQYGEDANFIYLDGGICPNEALAQFEKCNLKNQLVLLDDFHTKGLIINEKYKTNRILFIFSNGHKMALYNEKLLEKEYFITV